ncbi:Na+/H+ antiporter [Chryseolinea sp. T2]|uniref:Na+/H+ antiporter n=1 Tax=Chryseolinea sp. T2 TaxID=3129255 RepID=UPI0030770FF7
MENFEILIAGLTVLIALLAIAERFKLPQSVLLVLSGLGIAFIPAMPEVKLSPDVVFFIFLPPILYNAASNTSWKDFKSEAAPISILAIALVFFTTVTVGIVTHLLIPGFSWPLAFLLGAIVSPPDAVATTSITKGLGLNRRVTTILEGESLVNDASALIAYRFSIAAIGTGSFIFWQAGLDFLIVGLGGIVLGLVMGVIVIYIQRKVVNNSIINTSMTLITPFIVYLVAERIHTSGVLAVVTTGLMMSRSASELYSYQTRIRNKAVWDTLIFLLNGFIFILIGLQLRGIVDDISIYSIRQMVLYGSLVSIVTIVVRILWVFSAALLPVSRNSRGKGNDASTWKNVTIVAWTGTRGIVSLATALAIPLVVTDGSVFPHRSLILFLAFVVIFVTLVVQGLSLPILIKLLRIKRNDNQQEEQDLRLLMATRVVHFIETGFPYQINDDVKAQLKSRFMHLIKAFSNNRNVQPSQEQPPEISEFLRAQPEIQNYERQLLIQLNKDGVFSQDIIRRLEQELDLAELQLKRITQLKKARRGAGFSG